MRKKIYRIIACFLVLCVAGCLIIIKYRHNKLDLQRRQAMQEYLYKKYGEKAIVGKGKYYDSVYFHEATLEESGMQFQVRYLTISEEIQDDYYRVNAEDYLYDKYGKKAMVGVGREEESIIYFNAVFKGDEAFFQVRYLKNTEEYQDDLVLLG